MRRIVALVAVVLQLGSVIASAQERPIGDTRVFARVGSPGSPEGIAVRDGVVYVSTHTTAAGNAGGPPSKIFMFDLATGAPRGEIVVTGQDLSVTHGLLAIAFDAAGRLYVVDRNPGRLVRIDPATGEQITYATIPDLRACALEPTDGPCAPVTVDRPTFADYVAFDAAGNAYVTDLDAATIFRVPPGGGAAEVWYQDARFDGLFGLNGIAVDPTGTKLYFAMTGSQQPTSPLQGVIYTLPIEESPGPEDLGVFHAYLEPATGPDGIAFGASGRLYVVFAGHNQVSILEPDGTEAARFPDVVSNQLREVPYDLPASVAFDGQGSILVTNQSYFTGTESHWVVFDAWVGDTALAPVEPEL